jgi:beta-mannosidase
MLWLRDLAPGAGWGVLDAAGRPKLAWHYLRRALAPVAVWLVDEGLNGVSIHIANDTRHTVEASLRLALYRDEELLVDEAEAPVVLAPHTVIEWDAEGFLGRFVDIGFAYRFGEPQQDVVVATLARGQLLSQSFFYPVRAPVERRTSGELGLVATAHRVEGGARVDVAAKQLVRGVRLYGQGVEPAEDGLDLEPGRSRRIDVRLREPNAGAVSVGALNLSGTLEVPVR